MSNPRELAGVAVPAAAFGMLTGIAGYAAARLSRRYHHADTTTPPAGNPIPATPQLSSADLETGTHPHATAHVLNLNAAIARRPGLAIAITAIVMAAVTAAAVVLLTGPGPRGTLADLPPRVVESLPAKPSPPEDSPAQLIPAAESGEVMCPGCHTGQRFTLEFYSPWLVTQVGFRPLELVPGQRVTKVRWELHDPGRRTEGGALIFTQTEDAGDGHYIALSPLDGRAGFRTWRITAIVEATVADPEARQADSSARSPLAAYGHLAEDASLDAGDHSRPAAVLQPDALTVAFRHPMTLTRILLTPKVGA